MVTVIVVLVVVSSWVRRYHVFSVGVSLPDTVRVSFTQRIVQS